MLTTNSAMVSPSLFRNLPDCSSTVEKTGDNGYTYLSLATVRACAF